jgi:D-alanyl-D-alanine carboxypeptidase
MTLYMTFAAMRSGQLSEETLLPVSAYAANASPTKLGLRAGDSIRVKDAILGLVTRSANDAARVLAEAIGGSETRFARLMTQQAHRLGMNNTVFRNASGLPDKQQVTTPKEMAMLGRAVIVHFPEYYEYFNRQSFVFRGQTFTNHNRLMARYPGMDGMKTGFVNASGFNLISSAVQGGERLIGVVFGGRTAALRDARMERLLNNAFLTARNERDYGGSRYAGTPLEPKIHGRLDEPDAGKMETAANSPNMDVPDGAEAAPAVTAANVVAAAKTATLVEPAVKKSAKMKTASAKTGAKAAASGWGVQVGSYKTKREAQKMLSHVSRNYSDLKRARPVVAAVKTKGGTRLYRARLVGLTADRAQSACSALQARGRTCVTIKANG